MNNISLEENRLRFTFPCISAKKGDIPQLNGLGGVDFIVETEDKFLFIEIKDLENPHVPLEQRVEWRKRLIINKNNPLLIGWASSTITVYYLGNTFLGVKVILWKNFL